MPAQHLQECLISSQYVCAALGQGEANTHRMMIRPMAMSTISPKQQPRILVCTKYKMALFIWVSIQQMLPLVVVEIAYA